MEGLFIDAVKKNNVKLVQGYLKCPDVDPTAQDDEAIILASKNGYGKVVELLLDH